MKASISRDRHGKRGERERERERDGTREPVASLFSQLISKSADQANERNFRLLTLFGQVVGEEGESEKTSACENRRIGTWMREADGLIQAAADRLTEDNSSNEQRGSAG